VKRKGNRVREEDGELNCCSLIQKRIPECRLSVCSRHGIFYRV